jgi:hypothetical protein
VLIVNHANAGAAQAAQDALLKWVYDREAGSCCGEPAPRQKRRK